MGFTPLAPPEFDYKKHIDTLKAKRGTIKAFATCSASLIAKVADKTTATHWGNYLDQMLGFDTDMSISICQEQWTERDNPYNLTRQLIALTEQREQYARQLDKGVKAMQEMMKNRTGEELGPDMLELITGSQTHIITSLDAQITYVENQLKALERPQPAAGA